MTATRRAPALVPAGWWKACSRCGGNRESKGDALTAQARVGTQARMEPSGSDSERIRDVLRRAVRSACPPWLANDADDIVQTAWLRAAPRIAEQATAGPVSNTYLWKVATTTVLNEIRARRRHRTDVPLEDLELPSAIASADPVQQVRARTIREAIADCLAQLLPARRRALTLQLCGHEVAEVAALTGNELKRTRNLLFRGSSDLRECLANKGVTP